MAKTQAATNRIAFSLQVGSSFARPNADASSIVGSRRTRGDRGPRGMLSLTSGSNRSQLCDAVSVTLIQFEVLNDANPLGKRVAVQPSQGFSQIAGRKTKRLHQRLYRDRVDGRICKVQERKNIQVGALEIFGIAVAGPRG